MPTREKPSAEEKKIAHTDNPNKTSVKKTFADIKKELKQFRPNIAYYKKKGKMTGDLEEHHVIGVNKLRYVATVKGEHGDYCVTIEFNGVEYSDTRDEKKFPERAVIGRGRGKTKLYKFYKKPSMKRNKVMIRSTDPDFRFRFMKELADNGSLYPSPNAWIRYDAKKEDKEKGMSAKDRKMQKYYKVTHPKGGTYLRKTPHPKLGGIEFRNPQGLMGYSYSVSCVLQYLVKNEYITF